MAKPGGRLICPILRFAAARGLPLSSGTDTFSRPSRNAPPCPSRGSGRDGRGFPRPFSLGAQDPETWSGDQVGVLDPVVIAHSARPMAARQTQFTGGGAVRPRLAVRWVGGFLYIPCTSGPGTLNPQMLFWRTVMRPRPIGPTRDLGPVRSQARTTLRISALPPYATLARSAFGRKRGPALSALGTQAAAPSVRFDPRVSRDPL